MLKRALVLVVALAACGKDTKNESKSDPKSGPMPAKPAPTSAKPVEDKPTTPPPPLPELAGLFNCHAADPNATNGKTPASKNAWALPFTFAGCPTLPPVYGTAKLGMTADEVAKAAKTKNQSGSGYVYIGKHPIRYQFAFHSNDDGKVNAFTFSVDEDGFAQMKSAWGEPITYKALVRDELAWFNPAAKIKVTAEADPWSRTDPKTKQYADVPGYNVRYQSYTPLADVLGPEGIVQKSLLGATVDDINARFPGALKIKSAAQNKADLDKVGLDDKTRKGIEAMGVGGASANLTLPEIETGQHHLLVQPDWKDNKIVKYSFALPFGKGNDKLKNELLAQVVQSLGKPTNIRQDEYNKERWVYEFKAPAGTKIELRSDILGDGWTLHIEPAKS
jgi:hypothetical protein